MTYTGPVGLKKKTQLGKHRPKSVHKTKPASETLAISFMAVYPDYKRVKDALLEYDYEASEKCLDNLKFRKAKELEEARDKLGASLQEDVLKGQSRSNALLSAEAVQWTLERMPKWIEEHPDADLARIARDTQQISTQAAHIYALLDGKPTRRTQLSMPEFYKIQQQGLEEGWIEDESEQIAQDADVVQDDDNADR